MRSDSPVRALICEQPQRKGGRFALQTASAASLARCKGKISASHFSAWLTAEWTRPVKTLPHPSKRAAKNSLHFFSLYRTTLDISTKRPSKMSQPKALFIWRGGCRGRFVCKGFVIGAAFCRRPAPQTAFSASECPPRGGGSPAKLAAAGQLGCLGSDFLRRGT